MPSNHGRGRNNDHGRRNQTNEDDPAQISHMEHESAHVLTEQTQLPGIENEYDEENLGENFEETPWLPPTIQKAKEHRELAVFRGGHADIMGTTMCKAPDLGLGTALYFQFLKSMAVCMLVMTLLSIPTFVFSISGSRVSEAERDTTSLYRLTLGNIGYDPTSLTYATDTKCTRHSSAYVNQTCFHGFGYEVTAVQVSSIITASEFLQILAFFITVWHLDRKVRSLEKEVEKHHTSITDYAIMITGIPPDCHVDQLVAHFTNLYPMDTLDWKKRPALAGARPVEPKFAYLGKADVFRVGTWVAECTLFKKIGGVLKCFRAQEHLTKKLHRTRALMKMYADATPHARGPNARRYKKAEQAMISAGAEIDMLAEKVIKYRGIMAKEPDEVDEEGGMGPQRKSINDSINAPACAAFVVFEYSESMARCVGDYQAVSSFPRSLFYPKELKFRGHRIKVRKAPEPDSLVWENLEVPWWRKRFNRGRTALLALAMVIACFEIILVATKYKLQFAKHVPDLNYCHSYIPELYGMRTNKTDLSNFKWVRPPAADEPIYDLLCRAVVPGSHYAIYSDEGVFEKPVGKYDVNACASSASGLCPHFEQEVLCPCVSMSASEKCATAACSRVPYGPANPKCHEFEADWIGSCYCLADLTTFIKTNGVSSIIGYISSLKENPCTEFFENYSTAEGLMYAMTFVIVIINMALKSLLTRLTDLEAHSSMDKLEGALALKIFVTTYINMAVVVVVAYGYIPNLPSTAQKLFLFQGVYTDFTSGWYGAVGAILVITYVIQALFALVPPLASYYVTAPLTRWWNYEGIKHTRSRKFAMQEEVNELEVGPEFSTSENTAQILSLLFFAMTYAPGIPLLTLLSFLTFTTYFVVQKVLICRYHKKPPLMGAGVIRTVLVLLPYAAIIRLGIAIWMFGTSILPNQMANLAFGTKTITSQGGSVTGNVANHKVSTNSYQGYIASNIPMGGALSSIGVYARVTKSNVFPLVVLLAIIIAIKIIRFFWRELPFYWIFKCVSCVLKRLRATEKVYSEDAVEGSFVRGYDLLKLDDPLRQEMAPFSGDYFTYLGEVNGTTKYCCGLCSRPDNEVIMTEEEIATGWIAMQEEDFIIKKQEWLADTSIGGLHRKRRDFKKTFELIRSTACNSFDLEAIPAYRNAVQGLREGASNMVDYQHDRHQHQHKKKQQKQESQQQQPSAPAHKAQTNEAWKAEAKPGGPRGGYGSNGSKGIAGDSAAVGDDNVRPFNGKKVSGRGPASEPRHRSNNDEENDDENDDDDENEEDDDDDDDDDDGLDGGGDGEDDDGEDDDEDDDEIV